MQKPVTRYPNRKSGKRELVMISNSVEDQGTRFYGKIVLVKKKIPLIWNGKDFVKDGLPAEDVENTKKANALIVSDITKT